MKHINNKRGFTLVELLAVIVVLALIMGIAAYSMQGVTDNVKISSMKSSAITFVDGVRNMLLSDMHLTEGDYYFNDKILKTPVDSPFGGSFSYFTSADSADAQLMAELNRIGYAKASGTLTCATSTSKGSFIRVFKNAAGSMEYAVCLYDSANNTVFATEKVLLKDDAKSDYFLGEVGDAGVSLTTDGKIQANS